MLSKPNAGWSDIKIGEWSDRLSYLDDVPFMLLAAVKQCLEGESETATASVTFDAEGWEYTIVFGKLDVQIIESQDEETQIHVEQRIEDIAKQIATDILDSIDEWTRWLSYAYFSDKQLEARKAELTKLCNEVLSAVS